MDELLKLLENDPALDALIHHKPGVAGLTDVEETLLYSTLFYKQKKTTVIVKNNLYTAQQLYNRLYPLLNNDVLLFTMEESLRVEAIAATPSTYAAQMNVLSTLCLDPQPKLIITHPMGLIRYIPSKEYFKNHILNLKVNQTYSMNELKSILQESGYKQTTKVDQPLTFSIRGGVIDVFSIQDNSPIRIEFFDNEIDSIRYFDMSTQRTISKVDSCIIVPASTLIHENTDVLKEKIETQLQRSKEKAIDYQQLKENISNDITYLENHVYEHYLYRYQCFFDNQVSLLDYVDNCELILSNVEEIESSLNFVNEDNATYIHELFLDNRALNYYSIFNDFYHVIKPFNPYKIHALTNIKCDIKSNIKLTYFPLLPIDKMVEEIIRLSKNYQIHFALSKGQLELIGNAFSACDVDINDFASISCNELFEGFNYQQHMFLTGKELFGVKLVRGRYETKFKDAIVLDSYQDLKEGDYVVHNNYGIGRYDGIVTREINDKPKDFLQIRYKDNDLLLVPLEQFKLVRKFVCAEGVGIHLSKLGSNSWSKSKEKITNEVNDIAERLMKLYAARENDIGFAFSKDDEFQQKFENNFPYELTKDQVKVISEVKYDMEQPKPMDRLLCGDVGYGKTEVAMVAAFKACKDLKQVAYLCPTTILSRQHYHTFLERFKGFPFRVALLNRFVPEVVQKQIIKDVKEGKVDILIGTHRILSEDISYADLGLLIIDEEQRFGVQAKEKIKEIKKTIDVLSLSATPIPRTLQMSLVGVMSLSQLDTPPLNRMPVQTYVVEKNDSLIRETIQRELARNGQVFYLHNNVSDIYTTAKKIASMVPEAKIGIGHGQMSRDELEDVMYRFVEGEYNVLICTTIIETGIDIPNANTIIIENAENFGLSQLYQIRGRVGRSDRVAYAYLMYRADHSLSEVAQKRLQAIKDFTELGSGYKIAMRDLTIRGAGDLLGEKQAGFINTVGMSLYLELLNKAINRQKGIVDEVIEEQTPRLIEGEGYIPKEFVNQDSEKIGIYQKLSTITSLEELENYQEQLTDFYGKLPSSIVSLIDKTKIEISLRSSNVEKYEQLYKESRITLTESCSNHIDGVKLFENISNISTDIQIKYINNKISFVLEKKNNYHTKLIKLLEVINKL